MTPSDTIYFDISSTYTPSFSYTGLSNPFPISLFSTSGTILNFTLNRLANMSQLLSFNVFTIRTAPSLAPVSKFTVGVELFGYPKMRGEFGITLQVGVVTNITLTVDNLRTGALSTYRLSFVAPGSVRQSGAVRVYLPDNMQIPSNIKVYCQGIQLSVQLIPNTKCL